MTDNARYFVLEMKEQWKTFRPCFMARVVGVSCMDAMFLTQEEADNFKDMVSQARPKSIFKIKKVLL